MYTNFGITQTPIVQRSKTVRWWWVFWVSLLLSLILIVVSFVSMVVR